MIQCLEWIPAVSGRLRVRPSLFWIEQNFCNDVNLPSYDPLTHKPLFIENRKVWIKPFVRKTIDRLFTKIVSKSGKDFKLRSKS